MRAFYIYNNTEDIPRLYRRRGLFSRSVGVQSPTERKQFFELPLLVKSRALKKRSGSASDPDLFYLMSTDAVSGS